MWGTSAVFRGVLAMYLTTIDQSVAFVSCPRTISKFGTVVLEQ